VQQLTAANLALTTTVATLTATNKILVDAAARKRPGAAAGAAAGATAGAAAGATAGATAGTEAGATAGATAAETAYEERVTNLETKTVLQNGFPLAITPRTEFKNSIYLNDTAGANQIYINPNSKRIEVGNITLNGTNNLISVGDSSINSTGITCNSILTDSIQPSGLFTTMNIGTNSTYTINIGNPLNPLSVVNISGQVNFLNNSNIFQF
jgi:hypothetical protein